MQELTNWIGGFHKNMLLFNDYVMDNRSHAKEIKNHSYLLQLEQYAIKYICSYYKYRFQLESNQGKVNKLNKTRVYRWSYEKMWKLSQSASFTPLKLFSYWLIF